MADKVNLTIDQGATFCRLHIHGVTDQTSSSYPSYGYQFSYFGTGWGDTNYTTEVFLFN